MPVPVPVRVRACACPGTPHAEEGDTVLLLPTLSLAGGIRAQQDILAAQTPDGGVDAATLTVRWMETFVRHGAVGWNLVDEDGPVPFDIDALLADFALAGPVADAANDRYAEAVLSPLGLSLSASSPRGQTGASTSRTRRSRPSPR